MKHTLPTVVLAAALGTLTLPALADGVFPPITNDNVTRECAECHVLYRPEMLPAASWKAIMGDLASHFGEDASLEEPLRTEIEVYHLSHAADVSQHRRAQKFMEGVNLANPPKTVTTTPRFIRKHDELDPAVFTSKEVGSKARCDACHINAKNGDFDDDNVRIPGYVNLPFGITFKPFW